jgi:two-component system OmpR family sensor kinase
VRARFASLTSRLVLTAVGLVAVVSLLVAAATTLVMRDYLGGQLDDKVEAGYERTLNRATGGGGPVGDVGGDAEHAVSAVFPDSGADQAVVTDFSDEGPPRPEPISAEAKAALEDVPADGELHSVDLPGLGRYRVTGEDLDGGTVMFGLPTHEVDETISSLLALEALLTALGIAAAAGASLLVVRRQLRPLNEVAATANAVAALPLAEGDIDLAERVPEHLTDERTEVGQVGAALNALLTHVEASLEARHRSEQQVRQFVADASHELRTPLSTIAGYTELARTRPDPETSAVALGKVEEEAGRMTTLVEDLLLLARLDAGRPMRREPVDLTRLLVEAVNDARVLAPGHHWRIVVPDEPIEVTGDEQGLHQVVTNLLTNARKHTPPGTTVTVTGLTDGFDVHDDGPGFPPGLAPHAFERFARGDASRNRAGGAGLGLALVDAIVRSHAGSVRLTSEPRDTTVAVRLGSTKIV